MPKLHAHVTGTGGAIAAVALDGEVAVEPPPDRLRHAGEPVEPATGGRARALATALVVCTVLVPLALFTWRALHAPINFDGGMNLQVAESIARGDGYTRFYDEVRLFPHEVQTNGPYMYLAVLSIELLGTTQLAYQLANLVFVAGFLAVVAFVLRRESLAVRVAGPALVLLAAPMISTYGLGGLGEVPMTFFLLCAVAALVEGVRTPRLAPWWVLGASVAYGAALATKTFAIGAAGAVAVGGVCVLVAAPTRRLRWQALLAAGGVALLPVARELHRLVTIGSLSGYRAWWADQGDSISTQSGLDSGAEGNGPVRTFLDHMHLLSGYVDFPAELLLVVVFVPLVLVAAVVAWRWRDQGLRSTLSDPAVVLVLTVGALAASYILWWTFVVPDNKAWIRRIMPGLLALHLLYLLLVPWLVRIARALWRHPESVGRSLVRLAPAAALVGVIALGVPYVSIRSWYTTGDLVAAEQAWLDANRDAAAYVQANADQRYFGDEWWSAPVVSLMSHTGFYNLGDADFCALDPARDRLVWDHYAMTIRSQDPWDRGGKLTYEPVASFGSDVTIYSVGPAPGTCG
jgi:hypothetical protein